MFILRINAAPSGKGQNQKNKGIKKAPITGAFFI